MDIIFIDPDTCSDSELNQLLHYGTKRHSGRFPWGSGDDPYQHESWHCNSSGEFLDRVADLQKKGLSELEIAQTMGLSTKELRTAKSVAKAERYAEQVSMATKLREEGKTLKEIADAMGFKNDSSVRNLLDADKNARQTQAMATAEFLKEQVAQKGLIDVGAGAEYSALNGVSRQKFDDALLMLQMEGYELYSRGRAQVTNPGQQTILTVLCPPGTTYSEAYQDADGNPVTIHSLGEFTSDDNGETFRTYQYPSSLDSSRLAIRYGDEGGTAKDGVIEIRRGCDDLSLGDSRYAQVRILVDGTHYLKGMAIYSDDLPDGVDVLFNTNKKSGTPMMSDDKNNTVLKKIKNNPENPFGSLISADGQYEYTDADGNKQLGLINKTRAEGKWDEWDNTLPSQFLAKQSESLIRKQLNLTYADKQAEYEEICALENPTVKRQMLQTFAEECDSAAVTLKAAALPRQSYQVILPVESLSENEVYAPNYINGETVALVRYPHGGTFEIPKLTVNNNQAEAKSVIGDAKDAVGINSKVAERLSGADFDGDTVMVIPCDSAYSKVHITSTNSLEGLKGFDPKSEYHAVEGMKTMKNTQQEMGVVSNLIMDMTLKGATEPELAKAVRHSMVVIDAEKHNLNYKKSEIDNDIDELKRTYQQHTDDDKYGGASTLITKAKSREIVDKRRGNAWIDPDTGEQVWTRINPVTGKEETKYTGETYEKDGKTIKRTENSTKMAETKDAHTLSSGTVQEELYADYANQMKALANSARKEMLATGRLKFDSTAKKTYATEVEELNAQLNLAKRNAPKEREAQARATSYIDALKKSNPGISKEDLKKEKQRAITKYRNQVGAKRQSVTFTDRQWEAIQAGAVSDNTLSQLLKYADTDTVKKRATPRKTSGTALTSGQVARIKALRASGYSTEEIASALGVAKSTVWKYADNDGKESA
ncbi:MAG: helix-turn-helix domain-containing protein [Clostridiales bacterium]|nr:helix-turn-helix domain-containing protein [Clostridiales bacterium]